MSTSPVDGEFGTLELEQPDLFDSDVRHDDSGAPRWRRSLGWSATSAPVALLLAIGVAIGPAGINLLTPATLAVLDPAVPVALAALGTLVALGVGDGRGRNWRLVAAACAASLVTIVLVAAGIVSVASTTIAIGDAVSPWMLAVVGGLSAATSLTLPTADPLEPRTRATRVLELGVLLPIVGGGLALAVIRSSDGLGGLWLLGQACAIVLAAALAAFLLLTQATSETEERVVVVSALLLCGGVAAALGQSGLMAGLVAGLFWRLVGRRARDVIARDVLFVQHPLLVLVLLVAGARTVLSPQALVLGAAYALLRTCAKRLEAAFVDRAVRDPGRRERLGRHLLRPGIFGVAFALNVVNVAGEGAAPLLATVVVGTVAAEFVALAFRPVGPRA